MYCRVGRRPLILSNDFICSRRNMSTCTNDFRLSIFLELWFRWRVKLSRWRFSTRLSKCMIGRLSFLPDLSVSEYFTGVITFRVRYSWIWCSPKTVRRNLDACLLASSAESYLSVLPLGSRTIYGGLHGDIIIESQYIYFPVTCPKFVIDQKGFVFGQVYPTLDVDNLFLPRRGDSINAKIITTLSRFVL